MQARISNKVILIGVLIAAGLSACSTPVASGEAFVPLTASGFLEAEEVSVIAEVGGHVVELPVAEGDTVSAGDVVLRLDDTLMQAQRASAEAQVNVAEKQLALVQAREDLPQSTVLDEDIDVVQAQIELAQRAVDLVDAQMARLTLTAPTSGIVLTRSIHEGEVASPGVALMTIANLDSLELVVYLSESLLGRVDVGAPAHISVDTFPGETFDGVVTAIGREAEFTPRNVQTQGDRVNLVFAITIRIDNQDGKLKPGMPADATIEE